MIFGLLTGVIAITVVIMRTIGDRVRAARKARGLTTRDLAKLASCSCGYISRLEAGAYANPGLTTLTAIAGALGVQLLWLLRGTGRKAA